MGKKILDSTYLTGNHERVSNNIMKKKGLFSQRDQNLNSVSVFYELCDLLYHMAAAKLKLNGMEREIGQQNHSKAQISFAKFSFHINKMKVRNTYYR